MMGHLARLLWALPEAFHTRLDNLTGWRIIYIRDTQLSAADRWTWEHWPSGRRSK